MLPKLPHTDSLLAAIAPAIYFEVRDDGLEAKVSNFCEGFVAEPTLAETRTTKATDDMSREADDDWRDWDFPTDRTLNALRQVLKEVLDRDHNLSAQGNKYTVKIRTTVNM
jgi:hypothetical protein